MWYPFCISTKGCFSLLRTESCFEVDSFVELVSLMFGTNNHNPDIINQNYMPRISLGTKKGTEATIIFSTNKTEYKLTRYFLSNVSSEARIMNLNSGIVYYCDNAIRVLQKIKLPKILGNGRFLSQQCSVYRPVSFSEMKNMEQLANSISKSVGIDARLTLNYEVKWSVGNDELIKEFCLKTMEFPSFLQLIANLSQAIIKKRVYGYCEPIVTSLESVILNRFETNALLYQAKSIATEENIDLLICFDCDDIESLLDSTDAPRLKCYEY